MAIITKVPLDVRADLTILYQEPGRHYHNIAHIKHCLRELEDFASSPEGQKFGSLEVLEWAIWFHDAVYDPRSKKNESNSADLAGAVLQKLGVLSSPVRRLINCTKHNSPLIQFPHDDEKIMMDIDLAILGQSPVEYMEYSRSIRAEYSFVDEATYRSARSAILQGFLDRKTIYQTEHFRNKYETQARQNLNGELAIFLSGAQGRGFGFNV